MVGRTSKVIGWASIVVGVALAVPFLLPDDMSLTARLIGIVGALILVGLGRVVLSGTIPPQAESHLDVPCAHVLHQVVRELAPVYFAGFGYQAVKDNDDKYEAGNVIELQQGKIHFCYYEMELESYVHLRIRGNSIDQRIDKVPLRLSKNEVYAEVARQMQVILEKYGTACPGDATY